MFLALGAGTAYAVETPKNVIMVIGDGMGPAYTTAYRYFADDRSDAKIAQTVFDRNLVGMASTYPARESGYVTDSAAGATALSSATKSYNGAVGVDSNKQPTLTILEHARKAGLKTGVAVTSQINHATPASFAAHNESRHNYDAIADSYFDDKVDGKFALDVMLGGGWRYFIREDRNLVEEFQQAGYQYVDNLDFLPGTDSSRPLLGLFNDRGLDWKLDIQDQPRLSLLAETAIRHLENDDGFFLLVEGSMVDWAGHANDVASAMAEMQDMADTLEFLEDYVARNPDTLVVVTADHSTGGFTIGARGDYRWDPDWLKNLQASPFNIAKQLTSAENPHVLAESLLGFTLSEADKARLDAAEDHRAMFGAVTTILDVRTNTGWTTDGHTGVDVQVFAFGAGSDRFHGHMDNTDIPRILFDLMADAGSPSAQ